MRHSRRFRDVHRGPERLGEILERAGYNRLLTPLGERDGDERPATEAAQTRPPRKRQQTLFDTAKPQAKALQP